MTSQGPLCEPVLAFIKAFRLRGDALTLKQAALSRFTTAMLASAKKALWEKCSDELDILDLSYTSRRASSQRSQAVADLEDILEAFCKLDDADKLPLIFCEAAELVKLPPISVDSTAELVMANGACLNQIASQLAEVHDNVLELKAKVDNSSTQSGQVTAPKSYADAAKTSEQPTALTPAQSSGKGRGERSNNLVLFGLPEVDSLHTLRSSVDELLCFLLGKSVPLNDMFRLGRFQKPTDQQPTPRPRPVLLKLATSWDCRLIMSEVRKLKEFEVKGLFIREDLTPEVRLKRRESYLARKAGSKPRHASPASADTDRTLPVNSTEYSGVNGNQ